MRITYKALLGLSGFAIALATVIGTSGSALADGHMKKMSKYQVEDRRSGYTYATKETQAIQDDDFENPASIMADQGESLWSKVDGEAGKACQSCHNDGTASMKGVAARYPVYDKNLGKPKTLIQQINICRTGPMKAEAWKWESNEMLAMATYVTKQSRGMPKNVDIFGGATPFFKKGQAFYYQRRGQLDMACSHCHEDNPGNRARANLLSQGQSNGFPTYRLKWQKVGSLHRRFRGCNKNIRSTPYKQGDPEYVNLELYLAWRGRGLPVEGPSVRN
jgi:sulfur-oxidizing protein SoxA